MTAPPSFCVGGPEKRMVNYCLGRSIVRRSTDARQEPSLPAESGYQADCSADRSRSFEPDTGYPAGRSRMSRSVGGYSTSAGCPRWLDTGKFLWSNGQRPDGLGLTSRASRVEDVSQTCGKDAYKLTRRRCCSRMYRIMPPVHSRLTMVPITRGIPTRLWPTQKSNRQTEKE